MLPLVRTGAHLVLTLQVTYLASDLEDLLGQGASVEDLDLRGPLYQLRYVASGDTPGTRRFDGIRLLDLAAGTVAVVAHDDAEHAKTVLDQNGRSTLSADGGDLVETVQLVYGDLGVDEVALFIPQTPLTTGIPVIDGEVPEIAVLPEGPDLEPLDLGRVSSAPVVTLLSQALDLGAGSEQRASEDHASILLVSDVLFDSSSAELDATADAVIADAARTIAQREPGTVSGIGHTDDVDEDAFNQDLSRRRAEAVATVLGGSLDASEYPLRIDGRGESEPLADNTSAESRAINRRVELSIDTPVREDPPIDPDEPPPPFEGPTGRGPDGLDVTSGSIRPYRVQVPSARVVEGHLVVAVHITMTDDEVASVFGLNLGVGRPSRYGDVDGLHTFADVAVLHGETAVLPLMLRMRAEEDSRLRPLTDLVTNSRIDGGRTRISELVYPRQAAAGTTLTLQFLPEGWRLTDIPVSD